MKIAHYCEAFSPLSETFIYDVITELDQFEDINNFVFTHSIINQDQRPCKNIIELPLSRIGSYQKVFNKFLTSIKLRSRSDIKLASKRKQLLNLLHKYKPDVIHSHFGPQGCIALPVAQSLHIPLVVSFHGFDAFVLPKDQYWFQELKKLFECASAITVVSKLMQQHLIDLGCPKEKIHVIHVGKRLIEYSFKEEPKKEIRNFISIGRMEEKKGHFDCIHAFIKLFERYQDLHLTIIGSGTLLEPIRSCISEQKLEGRIQLLGGINHSEVKKHLFSSDAFILCSKTAADGDKEGVPTVLMEAQYIGLPCVTTNHSGIPEVIPIENHWLMAEEGNIDDIALKIETLIETSSENIKRAALLGRKKVENEFNLEIEASKLKQLYNSVIN